jgi:hypothetical protein
MLKGVWFYQVLEMFMWMLHDDKCLCKCYMIYCWKLFDFVKIKQCLCECYMMIYRQEFDYFVKMTKCLCKCYMIYCWKEIDFVKITKCLCNRYMIYCWNLLILSRSQNVCVNVTWYIVENCWFCQDHKMFM